MGAWADLASPDQAVTHLARDCAYSGAREKGKGVYVRGPKTAGIRCVRPSPAAYPMQAERAEIMRVCAEVEEGEEERGAGRGVRVEAIIRGADVITGRVA